jgi:hypothetical protein
MTYRSKSTAAAIITGAMAGAVAFAPAASAHDPSSTSNGVLVSEWSGVTYYLDRPSTQQIAATLRDWSNTGQAAAGTGSLLGCLRLRQPALAAACEVVVNLAGAYALDQVQQADEQGACLTLSIRFGLPGIGVSNGEYCHGQRG